MAQIKRMAMLAKDGHPSARGRSDASEEGTTGYGLPRNLGHLHHRTRVDHSGPSNRTFGVRVSGCSGA